MVNFVTSVMWLLHYLYNVIFLVVLTKSVAHVVDCTAAVQNLEIGQLSCLDIAEISLNVTLNHNQPTNQPTD